LKLRYAPTGECRRCAPPLNYDNLVGLARKHWGDEHPYVFQFKDVVGDRITVDCHSEYVDAITMARDIGETVLTLDCYHTHEELVSGLSLNKQFPNHFERDSAEERRFDGDEAFTKQEFFDEYGNYDRWFSAKTFRTSNQRPSISRRHTNSSNNRAVVEHDEEQELQESISPLSSSDTMSSSMSSAALTPIVPLLEQQSKSDSNNSVNANNETEKVVAVVPINNTNNNNKKKDVSTDAVLVAAAAAALAMEQESLHNSFSSISLTTTPLTTTTTTTTTTSDSKPLVSESSKNQTPAAAAAAAVVDVTVDELSLVKEVQEVDKFFVASGRFKGAKAGMEFKLGEKGQGYYKTNAAAPKEAALTVEGKKTVTFASSPFTSSPFTAAASAVKKDEPFPPLRAAASGVASKFTQAMDNQQAVVASRGATKSVTKLKVTPKFIPELSYLGGGDGICWGVTKRNRRCGERGFDHACPSNRFYCHHHKSQKPKEKETSTTNKPTIQQSSSTSLDDFVGVNAAEPIFANIVDNNSSDNDDEYYYNNSDDDEPLQATSFNEFHESFHKFIRERTELHAMGFTDEEMNMALLVEYKGRIDQVVNHYLSS
jgi:hypothetical protein